MSRVDDIRERAEAATPGPWEPDTAVRGDCVVWGPNGQFLANHQSEPHWLPDAKGRNRQVAFDVDRRDCEFIAHAREDIPYLLAEVERLEREKADVWDEGYAEGGRDEHEFRLQCKADNPYRGDRR